MDELKCIDVAHMVLVNFLELCLVFGILTNLSSDGFTLMGKNTEMFNLVFSH